MTSLNFHVISMYGSHKKKIKNVILTARGECVNKTNIRKHEKSYSEGWHHDVDEFKAEE